MPKKYSDEELQAAKTLALKLLWKIEEEGEKFAESVGEKSEIPQDSIEDSLTERFSFKGKTLHVRADDLRQAFTDADEHGRFMGELKERLMKTKAGKKILILKTAPGIKNRRKRP